MAFPVARKCKALMLITMLAVAEGARVQQRGAFSRESTGSNQPVPAEVLDQEPVVHMHLEFDVVLNDPVFREQLNAMAGHMDAFAELAKEKASIHARATAISNELNAQCDCPNCDCGSDSMLPEQMEAMIADPEFQEVAQMVAEDMDKFMQTNADFQQELEAVRAAASSEQASAFVSEKVTEVMSDPSFQQRAEKVSDAVDSLMQDPSLQREAEAIAEQVERGEVDMAQKVSEQVNAVISDSNFREKASNVILEMLSAEVKQKLDSTDGIDQAELQELLQILQNPSPDVLEAIADMQRSAGQSSLLEVSETSGEEGAQQSVKPLLSALMTTLSQGSAFNPGFASGRLGAHSTQAARNLGQRMALSEESSEAEAAPPSERMFQSSDCGAELYEGTKKKEDEESLQKWR